MPALEGLSTGVRCLGRRPSEEQLSPSIGGRGAAYQLAASQTFTSLQPPLETMVSLRDSLPLRIKFKPNGQVIIKLKAISRKL